MVGDSVREELASKVKVLSEKRTTTNRRNKATVQKTSAQIKLNPPPSPIKIEPKVKTTTAEINTKKTNRTLVEFQSKDGTLPEWRTQLKSAVRQRKLQKAPDSFGIAETEEAANVDDNDYFDSVEIIEEIERPEPGNPLLASALDRINSSREKYHIVGSTLAVSSPVVENEPVTEVTEAFAPEPNSNPDASQKTSINFPKTPDFKPSTTYTPNIDLYDTSELDPEFPPATVSSSFGRVAVRTSARPDAAEAVEETTAVLETPDLEKVEREVTEEYIEESAPFAYRFNAGLFDTLLTSFASLILLAPFMLLGGTWFSVAGVFAFLATGAIVSFIYLTTTIGLFGKSFGMHLFSLEMIDADGEEYPSLHQAAVSSSVFLLSMAFGGIGFIACLIDDERRAIHDMVSNTIVVREL